LESEDYILDKNGNHAIYEKEGCRPIQIPNHREINENTAKSILKVVGLI